VWKRVRAVLSIRGVPTRLLDGWIATARELASPEKEVKVTASIHLDIFLHLL
jgi:hypothetical protein